MASFMSENHQHARIETWITPAYSERLTAKMIHLFPGDTMPEHTTGPGREEVIVCIYGAIVVTLADRSVEITSGETYFIPENTKHAIALAEGQDGAQYAYVATKRSETGDYSLPANIEDLERKPFPQTMGELYAL
jgi:quercetin dioxygenase-like cupin family protein